MLPSSNEVEYFVEVSRTLNLSRAAERLGITQPTLSLAMKRLEDSIGTRLLDRGKTGVRLTKAGQKFSSQSRLLLDHWKKIKDETTRDESSVRGRYSLGCHASVGLYSLPSFLPELFRKWPDLELSLSHDLSRKVTEQVISYRVDFGIVVNPIAHPDLVMLELCRDSVTLWRRNKGRCNPEVLIYDPDLAQAQRILAGLAKRKITFSRHLHSSSLEIISSLAAAGAGAAILPARVAAQQSGKLIQFGKNAPQVEDRICLIFRRETRGSRAAGAIVDAIKAAFKAERQA